MVRIVKLVKWVKYVKLVKWVELVKFVNVFSRSSIAILSFVPLISAKSWILRLMRGAWEVDLWGRKPYWELQRGWVFFPFCFGMFFPFSGWGGFTCYLHLFATFWSFDLFFAWYSQHFGAWIFHLPGLCSISALPRRHFFCGKAIRNRNRNLNQYCPL